METTVTVPPVFSFNWSAASMPALFGSKGVYVSMRRSAFPVYQTPFSPIYTGMTSYFSLSTWFISCTALMMDTSRSQLREPKITPS